MQGVTHRCGHGDVCPLQTVCARIRRLVQSSSRRGRFCFRACCLGTAVLSRPAQAAEARHAIAMHGEPALPEDFSRLPYADPAAPKGGRLVQGVLGTFDSLNPFIVKGIALQSIRGYVVESLMARGYDEPFTLYGLLARTVETDAQRSYVTFHLDPARRFSDGKPVTADDVIFSWQLLRDKGRPNHRTYYAKVAKAEVVGERAVRFDLSGSDDRELPLILGLMPVLAKHAVNPETFEETSFQTPLGSGPYVVSKVDPGKSVTLKRDPNYWGRDLPINRGFWNFDEIRFDYYREANSHLEAFKRGLYDVRNEHDPGRWQTAYDFPAVRDGRVIKEAFPTGLPKASTFFVFNTRRAGVRRHSRARGDLAAVRLRVDQPQLFFRPLPAHRELFRRLGAVLARPAGGCARAGVARALLRTRCAPTCSTAPGRRRSATAPGATARRSSARSTCSRPQATSCAAPSCVERASGRPFAFEIMVTTRDEERLALLFVAKPQARRHYGARARRSTRCSTKAGDSPTIST